MIFAAAAIALPVQTLTTLTSFTFLTGGAKPYLAPLVQGIDGGFFGPTTIRGSTEDGTVFKITKSGALETLYTFTGADGNRPYAGLVQATNGIFYGTTTYGGSNDRGTVFEITPDGALTKLYDFCVDYPACPDGANPNGLMKASDRNLYGSTSGRAGNCLQIYFAGCADDGVSKIFRSICNH